MAAADRLIVPVQPQYLALARISHTFSRQIAALLPEIHCQNSEDSVDLTRPRYPDDEDRVTECASCPRKCEKCGLEGLQTLLEALDRFKTSANCKASLMGILLTQVDWRCKAVGEIVELISSTLYIF